MQKTMMIDGKEMNLVANAATPRIYRGLFGGKDLFQGIMASMKGDELVDSEVFENLLFVMAMQGGSVSTGTKIDDWLAGFESPTAIMQAAPEILQMWTEETKTASIGKKG